MYDDKENRDHYDRPSWSERDKKKDKSKHSGRDDEGRPRDFIPKQRLEKAKKDYMSSAGKLFKGKKGTSEHDKLIKKMILNFRKPTFKKFLKEYIEKYDFPNDWDTCLMLMDYHDPKIVKQAVENILKIKEEQSDTRKSIFEQKLRILKMATMDRDLAKYLDGIR